jgi:hypothetical protein
MTAPPAPLPLPQVAVPAVPATPAPASAVKLVAKAQPALSVSTLQDEAVVLFTIQGEKGYLSDADAVGKEKVQLDQLRFTVEITGAQNMTLTAARLPASTVELRHQTSMALRIDAAGLSLLSWMNQGSAAAPPTATWESEPPTLPLSKVGQYEVSISVELPLASGKRTVSAPKVKMERRVRGRSTTTIVGIEKIAKAAAIIHLNKIGRFADKDKLQPTLLSVDMPETKNQRLVRFWVPHGDAWKILFLEVVLERNGTVVKVNEQERFTCVAEGTQIDTEDGRTAVQDLKRGDRVWSWDIERARRVLSEVVAMTDPRPASTMLLAGKLRVTGSHPVYADGQWVRASELLPGAGLLSADGSAMSLDTIVRDSSTAQVYDISVAWPHNYFAEGILVHNKRLIMPPARLDPMVVLWERATGPFDLLKPETP